MPSLPKPHRLSYLPPTPTRERKPTGDQGFYNSPPWRKSRRRYLKLNPFCEAHAVAGIFLDVTFGGNVDHVVSRNIHQGAELDERNFCTLCKDCHDRKSALERHHGVLCETEQGEGGLIPAPGGKASILERLAKYI